MAGVLHHSDSFDHLAAGIPSVDTWEQGPYGSPSGQGIEEGDGGGSASEPAAVRAKVEMLVRETMNTFFHPVLEKLVVESFGNSDANIRVTNVPPLDRVPVLTILGRRLYLDIRKHVFEALNDISESQHLKVAEQVLAQELGDLQRKHAEQVRECSALLPHVIDDVPFDGDAPLFRDAFRSLQMGAARRKVESKVS